MGSPEQTVPIWKGCRQGALKSPQLWNALLYEALKPLLNEWEKMWHGIYLPHHMDDPLGCVPRIQGDLGGLLTHVSFTDGLILVAKSVTTIEDMRLQIAGACNRWGLSLRDDNLTLWSNFPRNAVRFGQTTVGRQARVVFLGSMICGEWLLLCGIVTPPHESSSGR